MSASDDAILTSIIASRLQAIGERMGVVVERSARSPLLVEGRDFSLGHLRRATARCSSRPSTSRCSATRPTPGDARIAEYFGDDVAEGDVVLHNDPYTGGNQLSDWKVTKPVFHDGEHVAWVVIAAHQADVGGAVPGSYNPNATDIWQEGAADHAAEALRAAASGAQDVWDLVFGNVRLTIVADDVTRDDRRLHGRRARAEGAARAATAAPRSHGRVRGLLDAAEQTARAVDRADRRRHLRGRVVRPRRRHRPRRPLDDPRRGHGRGRRDHLRLHRYRRPGAPATSTRRWR